MNFTDIAVNVGLKFMKKSIFIIVILAIITLLVSGIVFLSGKSNPITAKISIVSTLFPTYDFAKNIGGDKVEVTLLLPPGVEPHSFDPTPGDVVKINSADIFVYTGEFMEPWANDIIKGTDTKVKIVDASSGIALMKEADDGDEDEDEHEEGGHEHEEEHAHHHHGGVDPHIWLDFENAQKMAQNISDALQTIDPENAAYYQNNFETYKIILANLDNEYKNTLMACETNTIVYGGHYAFGYLAKRYGLGYVAAQGFSPDAEPSAKDMVDMVEQIKKDNIRYIFYEELTSPKIAETLSGETDAQMLLLNGAHNIAKDDYKSGVSYVSIMENNLKNLSIGLDCKK